VEEDETLAVGQRAEPLGAGVEFICFRRIEFYDPNDMYRTEHSGWNNMRDCIVRPAAGVCGILHVVGGEQSGRRTMARETASVLWWAATCMALAAFSMSSAVHGVRAEEQDGLKFLQVTLPLRKKVMTTWVINFTAD
jgi:hypothetical protein